MNSDKTVLILIGAPAAGKGTVAKPFQDAGFEVISTGDMLREEALRGTPLGLEADRLIKDGNLVPDEMVIGMVRERIATSSASGFIFDGFPRSATQAKVLDDLLSELGITFHNIHVLRLDVDDKHLRHRMKTRYHATLAAGRQPRNDDRPEVYERRLAKYKEYSKEVGAYYGNRLQVIDGNGSPSHTLDNVQLVTGLPLPPPTPRNGCLPTPENA